MHWFDVSRSCRLKKLLKKWTLENFFAHFRVLVLKSSLIFTILQFTTVSFAPKIVNCKDPLYIFYHSREIHSNPILFPFLLIRKCKNHHLSPKLYKTTPNFKLILINEVTVAANHKFFTLKSNGLKAIAANQGNHVE